MYVLARAGGAPRASRSYCLAVTSPPIRTPQAIRSCADALDLDAENVKALYRRATALEAKHDFDAARVDLERAAALAPDDKAVAKLSARVDAQLKRQAAKEKKMWTKAFGS